MSVSAVPSLDEWIREAHADESAPRCGMYLFHIGTVRESAREKVRNGAENTSSVKGMYFKSDGERVSAAVERAKKMPGIEYVRAWLNEGELKLGETIMLVLIGGDIRPRVIEALNTLVGELKDDCVTEKEIY